MVCPKREIDWSVDDACEDESHLTSDHASVV
jgi:hypothetical protein